MDENTDQPIGEPQPFDNGEGRKVIEHMAGIVALAVGGLVVFAGLLTPTRTSGASRSARLQWQLRQNEIREAMARGSSVPIEPQKSSVELNKDSAGQ